METALSGNNFEAQVAQIAGLGVWQIITEQPMIKRLEPVTDNRWNQKPGLFVTLKKDGVLRGSMGLLETTTTLPETLFDAGATAATHDKRYPPIQPSELESLEIEITLLNTVRKMVSSNEIILGQTGLIVSRGNNRGILLPQVAVDFKFSVEQFLEACCEKAGLSHKAWKDANTLVEIFECSVIKGEKLVNLIGEYVDLSKLQKQEGSCGTGCGCH